MKIEHWLELRENNFGKGWSEEQKNFIAKYDINSLFSWEGLSDAHKKDYQEIENYYSTFTNLLNEHYDDIKLYAIMNRKVVFTRTMKTVIPTRKQGYVKNH